jgi:cytochrome c oxidase subunit 2
MSETLALVSTRHEYEHVFSIYVPIALAVFGIVAVATILAVVVFRRRTPSQASRRHENNPLEAGYAVALALVVGFLLYVTFSAENQVDAVARKQRPQLRVNVFGARWEWHFQYPEYGINRYSGTAGHEQLVVPIDEPIAFRLVSLDVIHEFWVPELDYKHDLIPGLAQTEILTFTRTGNFQGHCGEFCGLYHTRMVFTVKALPPKQFAAWVASHRRSAGPPNGAGENRSSGHEGARS